MPELREPLAATTAHALREAVLHLRACERRRAFPPVVHVGVPGGPASSYAVGARDRLDQSMRADVVAALLHQVRADVDPLVWLTRPGELVLHDVDADWLAAAGQACAEVARPLTFVVVTRQGWWDPRSDVRRVWKRLRGR